MTFSPFKYRMTILFSGLLLFMGGIGRADEPDDAQYLQWRKANLIRVGLKKPRDEIRLACPGTLLLLDGDAVVGSLKPGGSFIIIAQSETSGPSKRWIQVQAGRSRSQIEAQQQRLEAKYPDHQWLVRKTTSGLYALRVGPFRNQALGESLRRKMIKEGFSDAFAVKDQETHAFQWVNKYYDKQVLRAKNPALVRLNPDAPIHFEGQSYRGILRFGLTGTGKIRVINELPLETYLRGVVPSELGPSTYPELEALKAQAVAARTYAIKSAGRFSRRGYDICDSPACQAYEGTKNEDPLSDEAVRMTQSLVLYHGETLIDALYTSTCGGQTEDVENVFPGRAEPYLRSKSSYIADFKKWELPAKSVPRDHLLAGEEDLVVRCILYGFPKPPRLDGNLTAADLKTALGHLEWVLGPTGSLTAKDPVSYASFWQALSALTFFREAVGHQINPADLDILLRNNKIPEAMAAFAALLVRYDLVPRDRLITFDKPQPISRVEAYRILLDFAAALGPAPDWRRYRLEGLMGQRLELSRGSGKRELDLTGTDYYVTPSGNGWQFLEQPRLELWDRVYIMETPFSAKVLQLKESGGVASVDRFSAFDSWIEKKDVASLEQRARRYIPGLKGITDVRVLRRSETGRVTLIEYQAESGRHQVDGLDVRWSLGVRDNLFDILPGYRNQRLVHITVIGRGWGHGVGMSQVGAFSLAKMGWSYDRILKYYYTDVEIRPHLPKTGGEP